MAIAKQVKVGGAFYKGEKLTVSASPGEYTKFMTISSGGCAINSVAIVPSKNGAGDHFALSHVSNATGGDTKATLAENIFNIGALVPINLDFIAMEKMAANEALKLSYTNVAAVSMEVFILVERGR